ncbi:MAG: site-specific integrase [Verrucomicrobia bacterium]|nr:site-specific integrase [Verrucomicrobiota bacterium]
MSKQAIVLHRQETLIAPALVAKLGSEATKRFYEFFTFPIRNKNTREAYYRAIGQFLEFFQTKGFHSIEDIEPIRVAAYIEWLSIRAKPAPLSARSIKQHMAGIRMFLSWLTEKGILAINPAREVKTRNFLELKARRRRSVRKRFRKCLRQSTRAMWLAIGIKRYLRLWHTRLRGLVLS